MKNMTMKYIMAGTVMDPSIPLHISSCITCLHQPELYWADCAASCIQKLTMYAARKPIVTASWYRDTIVPLLSAGETSDM